MIHLITQGILLPGEREVLTLIVYVDDKSANKLNLSTTHLDDIIILHTERGKDHFVAVTGTFCMSFQSVAFDYYY